MARSLSTEMSAITAAEVVRPIVLIDAEFDTPLYLWNGMGNLSHDSKTYVGGGNLLSISSISETSDLQANGMTVMLSGIGSSLITVARDVDYQGKLLTVKYGALDESGDVVSSPVTMFVGYMDTMIINDSGETCTIAVQVENRLIQFDRTNVGRYTDQDQKMRYPNDKGLEFVTAIQQITINWGKSGSSALGGNVTGFNDGAWGGYQQF